MAPSDDSQNILVLGGTGFLGSHVAGALTSAGHRVAVLSRGHRPVPAGVETLVADRHATEDLSRVLEGRRFDATVDFTAYDATDVERLLLIPYAVLGRYVLISSGQACLVTTAPRVPYTEDDSEFALKPEPTAGTRDHREWSYGVGKRRAEGALLALRTSHGVRGVVLRLPVMLGEGDSSLRTWAYLERMRDGGPLLLPEGGTSPVRFLYVRDLARLVRAVLENPPPKFAVYHVAQPDIVPLREVLERMARLAGAPARFVDVGEHDLEPAGIDRSCSPYSGPWISVLDPARAAAEWGFLASRLDDYMPAVVRWHLENPPRASHPGYAQRERERALAARLGAATV